MSRVLFCTLVVILVVARALPLHMHLHGHDGHDSVAELDSLHHVPHAHGFDALLESEVHHEQTVDVDPLGATLARDHTPESPFFVLSALVVLLAIVLWRCVLSPGFPPSRFIALPFLLYRPVGPRAPPV